MYKNEIIKNKKVKMGSTESSQTSDQSTTTPTFNTFGQPSYTGGISGYGSGIQNVVVKPHEMYPSFSSSASKEPKK